MTHTNLQNLHFMKKTKHILWLLCLLVSLTSNAQSISPSTLNNAGGSGIISGNTYEYSVGEMTLVNTASTPTVTVTQGILQPANNSTSISSKGFAQNQMKVFPNPASELLFVQTDFIKVGGEITFILTDVAGKTISKSINKVNVAKQTHELNIVELASGTYLLNVQYNAQNEQYFQSFKIQKSQ
jgi:hypothetical protein